MLVVTLKYVLLILRADNRGEGGGLALTALAAQAVAGRPRLRRACCCWAWPAPRCSTATASSRRPSRCWARWKAWRWRHPGAEALRAAGHGADPGGLFAVQRHGTATVGRWFGPVIVLWFAGAGASGLWQIAAAAGHPGGAGPAAGLAFLPSAAGRCSPRWAPSCWPHRGRGAVCRHGPLRPPAHPAGLDRPGAAGAGAELPGPGRAADARPVGAGEPVLPAVPATCCWPALVLATLAAIIASQAVISGAYLDDPPGHPAGLPAAHDGAHTSAREAGPDLHAAGQLGCCWWACWPRCWAFGSSGAGRGLRHRGDADHADHHAADLVRGAPCLAPAGAAGAGATLFFLASMRALVVACAVKFLDGGWFPLALGALLFVRDEHLARGRALLLQSIRSDGLPLQDFIDSLDRAGPAPRAAHRRLRRGRPRHRAAGAAAQPEAQPGAARAQPHPHRALPDEPVVPPDSGRRWTAWARASGAWP
jgi:KUP system potassium uptake protein